MTENEDLLDDRLSDLERRMFKILQDGVPGWRNRREINKPLGGNWTSARRSALRHLEILGLIESREGKNKKGALIWEYRAKDKG